MKFRKFLRSKRIEDIRQIGVERVIVMTLGSGDLQNHLILEMYSQGNIVLTDKDFRILALIRSHQFAEGVKTAVGEVYPFEHAANLYIENFSLTAESITEYIKFQPAEEAKDEEGGEKKKQK